MKRRMPGLFAVTLAAVLLFSDYSGGFSRGTPESRGLQVMFVRVKVSPENYRGTCPKRFNFAGKITVKGAGTVRYRWIRSDGAAFGEEETIFTAPGVSTRTVTTSWTLGAPGKVLQGCWMALQILQPVEKTSNRSPFTAICNQ